MSEWKPSKEALARYAMARNKAMKAYGNWQDALAELNRAENEAFTPPQDDRHND